MTPIVPSSDVTDWNRGTHIGRVKLPDGHALWLSAAGPARQTPSGPAIIIVHGLGGTAKEWVAVQRLIAEFARVYVYERAGYFRSDPPTKPPTAENIADELRSLLNTAGVEPPYLLVGHSYGGVLIRQYLTLSPSKVVGIVIVDSAPIVARVPPSFTELLNGAPYQAVVGLDANHCLTPEEYQTVISDSEKNESNGSIASQEMAVQDNAAVRNGLSTIAHPLPSLAHLSVIFCDESNDFRKIYEYGLQHGHGSAEAREALRKRLEDMSEIDETAMREHLSLCGSSRFVKAQGQQKTHNVHIVDPDFVAKEIQWVWKGCVERNVAGSRATSACAKDETFVKAEGNKKAHNVHIAVLRMSLLEPRWCKMRSIRLSANQVLN